MHPLLERQLKKCLGRTDGFGQEMMRFIAAVHDAYTQQDQDRAMVERSMELSSRELLERNKELTQALQERQDMQSRIVLSRQAGMAEVATGVLHNVGNVLNSVNVSAGVVSERLRTSKLAALIKTADLLRQRRDDLAFFLTEDEKGRQIPQYLDQLVNHLAGERDGLLREIASLTQNIDHVKQIVAMQQSYAKSAGVTEPVMPADLIEDAIRISFASLERHGVEVLREFQPLPRVLIDRHQVLQILINLISNAKHAMTHVDGPRTLTIRLGPSPQDPTRLLVQVRDTGMGIAAENLTRIFSHGFTTRASGHGFGLHTSALAAKAFGGSLVARSDGPGTGATFTLELPLKAADSASDQRRIA